MCNEISNGKKKRQLVPSSQLALWRCQLCNNGGPGPWFTSVITRLITMVIALHGARNTHRQQRSVSIGPGPLCHSSTALDGQRRNATITTEGGIDPPVTIFHSALAVRISKWGIGCKKKFVFVLSFSFEVNASGCYWPSSVWMRQNWVAKWVIQKLNYLNVVLDYGHIWSHL